MPTLTSLELGNRIRQLRLERGLTLKEIEAKVGISATHVSEVERGRTSPTIGALARIADALGVRPSHLVDFPLGERVTVARVGQRLQLTTPARGGTADVLIPAHPFAELSLFLLELQPGHPDGIPGEARIGDKILHVLEGEIDLMLGDDSFHLKTGETIHFRSTHPQRISCHGDSPARILWAAWPRFTI